jgi:hypothetical protein
VRLPLVPLAAFRAFAWAEEPAAARAHAHVIGWSSLAWSAPIATAPAAPSRVSVASARGAALTSPGVDGGISRRGRGVAWSSPPGALVTVSLRDVARERDVVRAHTGGSELSWKRLDRLGVARPATGEHLLDLVTRGATTVDELAAPPPSATAQAAGWTAEQRRRVVVTP